MTAPRGYGHLTSAGRTTTGRPKVAEVESQPCPATLGSECHELRNTPAGVTRCTFCRETWAAIDAAIRAGVGWAVAS
jgi:hypothetical protein